MEQDKVLAIIQEFFAEKLHIENLTMESSLKEYSEFDSLMVVELILYLEETFGIEIPEEDYAMENYESIQGIMKVVEHGMEMKTEE